MVYSLLSSLGREIGPWAGGQPCLALTISSIASSSQPSPWGFSRPCLGGVRALLSPRLWDHSWTRGLLCFLTKAAHFG